MKSRARGSSDSASQNMASLGSVSGTPGAAATRFPLLDAEVPLGDHGALLVKLFVRVGRYQRRTRPVSTWIKFERE